MKTKISVYIDGFNLYHSINTLHRKTNNHYKWLDLSKLILNYIDASSEEILQIFFFSAPPIHMHTEIQERHSLYKQALEISGIKYVEGQFKEKKCGCSLGSTIKHEEKESDVNLAIQIVSDAYEKISEKIIIITNDSDIAPAIRMAKLKNPELSIVILTPPLPNTIKPNWDLLQSAGQMGTTKKGQIFRHAKIIKEIHIARSLFPEEVISTDGKKTIKRPKKYNPKK